MPTWLKALMAAPSGLRWWTAANVPRGHRDDQRDDHAAEHQHGGDAEPVADLRADGRAGHVGGAEVAV